MTHLAAHPIESGWPHDATPEELYAEAHANDRPHYHVWNQYGDDPASTATTLTEARRQIIEEANVWRYDLNAYVRGNARQGYYTIQWNKDSMGSWGLWIEECTNPECLCFRIDCTHPDHFNDRYE